jgi:predicted TIM-barrel fold metal-dependent hydrolase
MPRIDLHAHLTPRDYVRELAQRSLLPQHPLQDWIPEISLETMDRWRIDATVLSLTPPGVFFGDQGLANELARLANEETAACVRAHPATLGGLGFLPLPDIDAALAELDYALGPLGLDGIELLTNVAGIYLGDPLLDPLFDELDRRGAYVFVHPTTPARPSPVPHLPEYLIEYPMDTTRAVVNLLFSGTLDRCPNIRLQVAHLGGMVPFIAHRIATLVDRQPALATRVPAGPIEYLRRLYYDTGLSDNAVALASTIELVGAQHVVYGTDWPYVALPELGVDPSPGLADALDADARRCVDWTNASRIVPRLVRAAIA